MAAARLAIAAALACLLAASAVPVSAENLLLNPHFDTSLAGWQTTNDSTVAVSWDGTRDANGSPSSGSAKAVWQGPTVNGIYPTVFQCVDVTPATTYTFGGKVFIPSGGQTTSGSAFFIVTPFPSAGCSGPPPPSALFRTPPVLTRGTWIATTSTITSLGGSPSSIWLGAYLAPDSAGTFQASFDDVVLLPPPPPPPPPPGCTADEHTLCFLGNRFKVTATFDTGNGSAGPAWVDPAGSSGLLWFFDPANIEAVLKVLDGCVVSGHFWFFAGGLTNVQVTIEVTDTRSGTVQTYRNPRGTPFAPIQDTAAFSCSP